MNEKKFNFNDWKRGKEKDSSSNEVSESKPFPVQEQKEVYSFSGFKEHLAQKDLVEECSNKLIAERLIKLIDYPSLKKEMEETFGFYLSEDLSELIIPDKELSEGIIADSFKGMLKFFFNKESRENWKKRGINASAVLKGLAKFLKPVNFHQFLVASLAGVTYAKVIQRARDPELSGIENVELHNLIEAILYIIYANVATVVSRFIIYKARSGYVFNAGTAWDATTADLFFKTYLKAFEDHVRNRNIPWQVMSNRQDKIWLIAKFNLPDMPPPKITISVKKEGHISIFPEEKGGFTGLDKYNFTRLQMDVKGKTLDKRTNTQKQQDELYNKYATWLDRDYLGVNTKVPKRPLMFQYDFVAIWGIALDMMSEFMKEAANKMIGSIQMTDIARQSDTAAFDQAAAKYNLFSVYLRKIAGVKDEDLRQMVADAAQKRRELEAQYTAGASRQASANAAYQNQQRAAASANRAAQRARQQAQRNPNSTGANPNWSFSPQGTQHAGNSSYTFRRTGASSNFSRPPSSTPPSNGGGSSSGGTP